MTETTTERVWTPAQRDALEREGDVLVRAAAGSGKTGVLTGRIVRAVVEDGIDLRGIYAVTFTEKAAQEMRTRVAERLTELGRFDEVAQLEHAAITTLHGLCSRLLREFGTLAGIDPRFRLLDAAQAQLLSTRAFEQAIVARATTDQHHRMQARYGISNLAQLVQGAAAAARQRLDGAVTFVDPDVTTPLHVADLEFLNELLEEYERRYARSKRLDNALDFDDLELRMLDLLEREDVVTELRGRVQRLLVDEFQDTNAVQVRIVQALGAGRTFMVGDEWQSIYRFRKADVSVFRDMAVDMGSAVIRMGENFRSARRVLDPVNELFDRMFGEGYDAVEPARADADESGSHAPCEIVLVRSKPNKGERATEAAAVAHRIAALVEDGANPGDIAVLMPRTSGAAAYEQAIGARGVRTVRQASRGFFDSRHVADVTSLLAWAWNSRDDRAALTVLASPVASLDAAALLTLRRSAATLAEAVESSADARVVRARELRDDVRRIARAGTLVDVVDHAVHSSGLAAWALRGTDGLRAAANLRKLIEIAAGAADVGIDDVGGFLQLVDAQQLSSTEGDATVADEHSGAVRLMTVHASKGLEFPYVFVVDLSNAGNVGKPKLLVGDDGVAGIELRAPDGLEAVPSARLELLRQCESQESRAEEQRLLYVALTRARERTVLSGTFGVKQDGSTSLRGPLAWLLPALQIDPASMHFGTTPLHTPRLDITIVEPATPAELAAIRASVASEVVDLPVFADPVEPLVAPDAWLRSLRDASTNSTSRRSPEHAEAGAAVAADQMAARLAGTRAHAALEFALGCDAGSSPAAAVLEKFGPDIATVVAATLDSDVLAELRARGARAEVPYVAPGDDRADAGAFDAVVVADDAWWIVDWKATLPESRAAALRCDGDDVPVHRRGHGRQVERYAAAALAAGAREVRVTLVAIDRPTLQHEIVRSVEPTAH